MSKRQIWDNHLCKSLLISFKAFSNFVKFFYMFWFIILKSTLHLYNLNLSSIVYCLCFYQGKIYMYGGKIDSTGNVSSQLWVFHIQNQTWVLLSPRAKDQYAVVGHSAHIVPPIQEGASPIMLVLFGHCPLYGYISQVQEYNIGE